MEICKVCGAEKKIINYMHVKTHDGMTMKEYNTLPKYKLTEIGDIEEIEELDIKVDIEDVSKGDIDPKNRLKNIMSIKDADPNRSLQSLLDEFDVTERELVGILSQYKKGRSISTSQSIVKNQKAGDSGAFILKDEKECETTSLHVAEALEKSYGFICVDVRRGPPKTWSLIKK